LIGSYQVAFKVAKYTKPHAIAEELIKSWILEMATKIFADEAGKKFKLVLLSNYVIQI